MNATASPATVVGSAQSRGTWWAYAFVAVCGSLTMLLLTPRIYGEVLESRKLAERGASATGTVIGHNPITGRSKCSSTATVQYVVAGVAYEVPVQGCGAQPEFAPRGAQASVTYVVGNPAVAGARLSGASTSRFGWPSLFGGWAMVLVCALYARHLWAQRSKRTSGSAHAL
jgi:hypothetical protein